MFKNKTKKKEMNNTNRKQPPLQPKNTTKQAETNSYSKK